AFFADRLKVHLKEQGVRHDLIDAVFSLGGEDDILRLLARVEALKNFLDTDDGGNLLVAYRRAANIVRIEEKKDGARYDDAPDAGVLQQAEEKTLFDGLSTAGESITAAIREERFADAMTALAELRAPVDAFFDKVTVNCDDAELRKNRLRLLARIGAALGDVADFSKIEG
ncbi:MAG: DALR anticodon-binding domain-containing protein, partial [Rhodospirillales bacterium]|nr:DALR anticodon-binding domain-containing protein [Rhodospirillales bacterium]